MSSFSTVNVILMQVGTLERAYHFMPRSACADLADGDEVRLQKESRRHCLSRRALVPRDNQLHLMLSSEEHVCDNLFSVSTCSPPWMAGNRW
jgi:hypothetical protein